MYWSGDEHHVRAKLHPAPETIQIEYWGTSIIETAGLNLTTYDSRNTYKTVRIVGDNYGYLYSHWCTNETEAYDTVVRLRLHRRISFLLLTSMHGLGGPIRTHASRPVLQEARCSKHAPERPTARVQVVRAELMPLALVDPPPGRLRFDPPRRVEKTTRRVLRVPPASRV